jgi:eukaryotic-like serine/threonine-protein kinase
VQPWRIRDEARIERRLDGLGAVPPGLVRVVPNPAEPDPRIGNAHLRSFSLIESAQISEERSSKSAIRSVDRWPIGIARKSCALASDLAFPIMSTHPSREESLFAEALEHWPADRAAFLARACGSNVALLARIAALIAAHEGEDSLLASTPLPAAVSRHEEKPGDVIGLSAVGSAKGGRYKLLQKIGEGGCGVVWMAEQQEPVHRRVALKVIKLGMDTKAVLARFEAERQALAMMDHPNIAKVLDGGATDTGRPFFVMELVRGIPITRYCDENHLTPTSRLELFIKACHAVQHAHEKAIIHRDLKPANILVTLHDGVPVPKVIDFGIAKATQGRLTDATVFTAFEQFIGTPVYMSPEQAEMSGLDIDTRSDIYSLGVLLYELLTGHPPFDPKSFASAGVDEIRHHIREDEPPKPSTRLRTLGEVERTTVARHRGTALAQLSVLLRGDLDWIVMKCLEKDRTRRYDTANGLAMDIQRHLGHEPVVARPPTTGYLIRKIIRRHRVGFAATVVVVCSLAAGLSISTWSLLKERAARERAVAAERNETELRQNAESKELAARRRAYAADMNLVQQALANENLGHARELLYRHRPKPGLVDVRGWEWRYLWRLCQSDAQAVVCDNRNRVGSVAASPDGQWLAIADVENGALSLMNLRTGQQLPVPAGEGYVWAAFSPREPLLAFTMVTGATPNAKYSIALWDVATQRKVRDIPVAGAVDRVAFCDNGHHLVGIVPKLGEPSTLAVWRVSSGELVSGFPLPDNSSRAGIHGAFATARDFSSAAHHIGPRDVRVVDLATGAERWRARAAAELINSMAFSPDGRILATGSGRHESSIRLWDVGSGREIGRLEGHRASVRALVFWPDGRMLASASGDQTIRLCSIEDRRLLKTLRGHTLEVWALALLPDNRTLVSGSKDGAVFLWDTSAAPARRTAAELPKPVRAWRFTADSQAVITLDSQGRVDRWAGPDFENHVELAALEACLRGVLDPERSLAALWVAEGTIALWNWTRLMKLHVLHSEGGVMFPVAFVDSGRSILVARGTRPFWSAIEEWSVATGRRTKLWPIQPTLLGRVFASPDGRRVALSALNGHTVIDLTTGSTLLSSIARTDGPAFSMDGTLLSTPEPERGFTRVRELTTGREIATLRGFLQAQHSSAFSPDGSRLAVTGQGEEAVRVWDMAGLEHVITLPAKAGGVSLAVTAFSPDGNSFGSAYGANIIHFWRAPSWEEIEAAEKAGKHAPVPVNAAAARLP